MLIQQFVPKTIDVDKLKMYYVNVMVWVCGSFAFLGLISALSMIPIKIGRRWREVHNKLNDE